VEENDQVWEQLQEQLPVNFDKDLKLMGNQYQTKLQVMHDQLVIFIWGRQIQKFENDQQSRTL